VEEGIVCPEKWITTGLGGRDLGTACRKSERYLNKINDCAFFKNQLHLRAMIDYHMKQTAGGPI
jgi:hypothetical protein